MGIAVGIDLGTTNSCVAVVQADRARVLEDRAGRRIQPSVLSFLPDGSVTFGYPAKERRIIDPENTIHSTKRLIGRSPASADTKRISAELPYKIIAGPDDIPVVSVRNRQLSLPEVSALMLQNLKAMCVDMLNVEIDEAVITVPANFDDMQRSSTKVAGRIAGFNVLRIINEPTAAALAYGFGGRRDERIAVYDFGGGTFDITIVELSDDIFEVLSTAGDTCLGGEDFDNVVLGEMLRELEKHHKVDLTEDPTAMQRLRAAAERVKCRLSTLDNVQATLQNIAVGSKGEKIDFFFKLSRTRFEELTRPLVDRSFDVCREALKLAGIKAAALQNIVMVGGSTRIPLVRKRAAEVFGIVPRTEINPDEVVAVGAAIQAFSLTGEQLPEVLPPRPLSAPSPKKKSLPAPEASESNVKVSAPDVEEEALGLDVKRPETSFQPDIEEEALGLDVKRPEASFASAFEDDALGLDVKRPETSLVPDVEEEALGLDVKRPASASEEEALGLDVKHPEASFASKMEDNALGMDVKEPSFADFESPLEKRPADADKRPLDIGAADDNTAGEALFSIPAPPVELGDEEITFGIQDSKDAAGDEAIAAPEIQEDEVGAVPGMEPRFPEPVEYAESPSSVEVTDAAYAKGALLLDVTPRALGLAVAGGFCDIVIERNAAIPVEQSRLFTTSSDNQTEVAIDIYQGESRRIEDNTKLGRILLSRLRPAPRGEVKIRVTFEIDTDGILGVSAGNEDNNEAQSIKIVLSGGMDEAKVKALMHQYSSK